MDAQYCSSFDDMPDAVWIRDSVDCRRRRQKALPNTGSRSTWKTPTPAAMTALLNSLSSQPMTLLPFQESCLACKHSSSPQRKSWLHSELLNQIEQVETYTQMDNYKGKFCYTSQLCMCGVLVIFAFGPMAGEPCFALLGRHWCNKVMESMMEINEHKTNLNFQTNHKHWAWRSLLVILSLMQWDMLDKLFVTMFRLHRIARSSTTMFIGLLLVCYLANTTCAIINIMTTLIFIILIVSRLDACHTLEQCFSFKLTQWFHGIVLFSQVASLSTTLGGFNTSKCNMVLEPLEGI